VGEKGAQGTGRPEPAIRSNVGTSVPREVPKGEGAESAPSAGRIIALGEHHLSWNSLDRSVSESWRKGKGEWEGLKKEEGKENLRRPAIIVDGSPWGRASEKDRAAQKKKSAINGGLLSNLRRLGLERRGPGGKKKTGPGPSPRPRF